MINIISVETSPTPRLVRNLLVEFNIEKREVEKFLKWWFQNQNTPTPGNDVSLLF